MNLVRIPFNSKMPLRLCIAWLLCTLVFTLLLFLISFIPRSMIADNLSESTRILQEEGLYQNPRGSDQTWQSDNFTSAIMLNIMGTSLPGSMSDVLLAPRVAVGDSLEDMSLNSLSVVADGADENAPIINYPRYWHGYEVLLKPLLVFFNINQIRQLALIATTTLSTILAVQFAQKRGIAASLSITVPLVGFNIVVVCQGLSLVMTFFVGLIASVLLGATKKWWLQDLRALIVPAFLCGAITNYLDFLCTPLIALGLPLLTVVTYCFDSENLGKSPFEVLKLCLVLSIAWACGYGLLWVTKWLLCTLVTGYDALGDAMGAASMRTSTSGGELSQSISRLDALKRNVNFAFPWWSKVIILAGCIAALASLILLLRKKNHQERRIVISLTVGCAFIAMLPIVWYLALSQHSYVHTWFTYRNLMLCVNALLLYLSVAIPMIKSGTTRAS